ncbi:hypothetical protein FOQG_18239 [Fusarium oxysporum f. sp. raphani 54005]|uniref:Uncharacterized protein n=2 Tax=Fusarium oxysporum f. sp. raphani TaxID=96318 RepID=X0B4H1_FUSOX|nr:hypothetical protein FOQG_18239 [Fusarium oxysporum f. sp. raphani 54005]KAG7423476.1 hypothetical protein Forpi1262_v015431 [Fusarium oxysporum f. sp. raphani]
MPSSSNISHYNTGTQSPTSFDSKTAALNIKKCHVEIRLYQTLVLIRLQGQSAIVNRNYLSFQAGDFNAHPLRLVSGLDYRF